MNYLSMRPVYRLRLGKIFFSVFLIGFASSFVVKSSLLPLIGFGLYGVFCTINNVCKEITIAGEIISIKLVRYTGNSVKWKKDLTKKFYNASMDWLPKRIVTMYQPDVIAVEWYKLRFGAVILIRLRGSQEIGSTPFWKYYLKNRKRLVAIFRDEQNGMEHIQFDVEKIKEVLLGGADQGTINAKINGPRQRQKGTIK